MKVTDFYLRKIRQVYDIWLSVIGGKEAAKRLGRSWLQQNLKEFSLLLNLLRVMKPKKLLELGFGFGGSAMCFVQILPSTIVVDVDIVNIYSSANDIYMQARRKVADYLKSTGRWFYYCGDTKDPTIPFKLSIDFGLFDVLFIDACHLEDYVIHDFNIYSQLVRAGGLIVFHDTSPTSQRAGDKEVRSALNKLNIWVLEIEDKTAPKTCGISYTIKGMERPHL